jgi:two-component system, NtrC family, sensor kinase
VTRHLSIPTRIFLGYAAVLLVLSAVAGTSLLQHTRTAASLRLLHEGYLPLALTLGEAKSGQAVLFTWIDRVPRDESSGARSWLEAALRVRPATLTRARHGLDRATRLVERDEDRNAMRVVATELEALGKIFEANGAEYAAMFDALERGDGVAARTRLDHARQRELEAQRRYRNAWREVQERIAATSSEASAEEARAAVLLVGIAVFGILLGIFVVVGSQRILAPLPRLHARVQAVARGDLTSVAIPSVADDELGRLAREFERMVAALASRDEAERLLVERLLASERLAAIGRMASHVTHEVRNPLSSIALNVEMLEDELPPDAKEARALLRPIQREIDRLTGITAEYLHLARVPSPRLESCDMRELVLDVCNFVGREMESASVELDVRVSSTCELPIAIDEAQIRQALLNLLRNAREAMPRGGALHVSILCTETELELRVADTGEGMEEEVREHVFDLFFSTKSEGTGLGLPLTRQIVEAHGGTIRCESEKNVGTAFVITLPLPERNTTESTSAAHDEN